MIASQRVPRLKAVESRAWNGEAALVVVVLLVIALLRSTAKFLFMDDVQDSVLGEVVWGSIYALAAIRLIGLRANALALARQSKWLFAFLGLTVASSLWASDPFTTFKDAFELLGTTLVAWYIVSRFSLAAFLRIVAVAFTIISAASVLLVFASPARGRMDWGAGPWSGVFDEKNGLGAAMAIAIITAALLIPSAKIWLKVVLGCVLALAALLLVGSDSITAFLACSGTALIVAVVWASRRTGAWPAAAIMLFCAGAAVVVTSLLGLDSSSFLDALGRNANLTGRTEMWPPLIRAIEDRPFLGYGFANFFNGGPYQDYLGDFIAKFNWVPPHAHNSFIQIALDTGLIGLGVFLVVLFTALRRDVALIVQGNNVLDLWPFALVVYLILGSYDETYFAQQNTLEWIFFVAALLYPLREMRTRTSEVAQQAFRAARSS
jgi:O-antigen ligase